ncbi:tumor necrosis factor receptor superfamily member 10A [Pipistrellus kuhlii]|uniref:tumor necrosis factor receptor superfamily member 10A n=1 Tax=Pipistrellus kuhlii TaxID=59472 RepID=UPI001E272D47|nr:tumor necrosis factor receptor superfamily member 10A [Pipistrellus kuhlii]
MAWRSMVLSLLLLLLPPPPLLLLGSPLTLSTWSNLPSEPSPGSRCGPGEYPSARHCCQRCPPGYYVEEPCSSPHTRSECVACDAGTYTGHANGLRSCLLCTTCRQDQEMVRDCTPTRDRQCQCKPGEFYCASGRCPETCYRCTSCPGATLRNCTATTDTVCAPGAPAQPGPSACSLALVVSVATLVIVVVAFIVAVAVAIACWRRGGVPLPQWLCRFTKPASVEPGSHGHILKTTDPESGLPAPNAETTQLLREASTLTPGAQTRPGPSADPDPDPGAGVELQVEVEVEVEGGGREAPEPAPPSPAAAAPGALTWAEAAAGLRPPEQEHKCLFGEGHALTPPIGSLVNLDLRPQDGTRARAGRKEMAAGPVTFCALEPVAVL